jgi:hypothetical protein
MLEEAAKDQPKAQHDAIPLDGPVDVGHSHADMVEGKRRGHRLHMLDLPMAEFNCAVNGIAPAKLEHCVWTILRNK